MEKKGKKRELVIRFLFSATQLSVAEKAQYDEM